MNWWGVIHEIYFHYLPSSISWVSFETCWQLLTKLSFFQSQGKLNSLLNLVQNQHLLLLLLSTLTTGMPVNSGLTKNLNICRKAILEEVSNGIHGLAYECTQICRELELPDIMGTFANKNRIKSSIFLKMNEKALEDMRNSNKVSDRLTDNPQAVPPIKISLCYNIPVGGILNA